MKFHIHIPRLREFALDAAADGIVVHGKPGLQRSMPLPLYYDCITAFGRKYDNNGNRALYSDGVRLYRKICKRVSVVDGMDSLTLRASMMLLDHDVVDNELEFDDLRYIFVGVTSDDNDVDVAISCIHRFASRCLKTDKMNLMSRLATNSLLEPNSLLDPVCSSIFHVLVSYGGVFDTQNVRAVVRASYLSGNVKSFQQTLARLGNEFDEFDVRAVIQSANIEMIMCLGESGLLDRPDPRRGYGRPARRYIGFSAVNFDVQTCELLLSLGYLEQGMKRNISRIRSIPVLKWFIEHDVINIDFVVSDTIYNVAQHGGVYFDVLRYLFEQVHVDTLPRNRTLLIDTHLYCSDHILPLLDYLIGNGADVNATRHIGHCRQSESRSRGAHQFTSMTPYASVAHSCPMLIRYWLDRGLIINGKAPRIICNSVLADWRHMPVNVIEFFIEVLHLDVTDWFVEMMKTPEFGNLKSDPENVKMLLKHCTAPLILACYNSSPEVVRFLIDQGADVNYSDDGRTPLIAACNAASPEIVKLLIDHGADIHADVGGGITLVERVAQMIHFHGYDSPHGHKCREIIQTLIHHGANPSVTCYSLSFPIRSFDLLSLAFDNKDVEMMQLLLEHGAIDDREPNSISSLYIRACQEGSDVKNILAKYCKINE